MGDRYQVTEERRSPTGHFYSHPATALRVECPCGMGFVRLPEPDAEVVCPHCDRRHSRRSAG